MKPIATIHWNYEGQERSRDFYRMDWLNARIRRMKCLNMVFYVCFTSSIKPIPRLSTPKKPVTASYKVG